MKCCNVGTLQVALTLACMFSQPSNYKIHLFSESNPESEKSWICNSQNHTLPKVADYTRKKTRVRSKLKGKNNNGRLVIGLECC